MLPPDCSTTAKKIDGDAVVHLRGRQGACLHNLARNDGVFVEHVDSAEPMVAVGDNQFARSRVPHQQEGRKLLTMLDLLLILLDM